MKVGKDFWSEHVAGAKREGGPANEYARRHGISVASLYYWQRKLKAEEIEEAGQPSKFVSLLVSEPVVAPCSPGCTLVLPSGMRLELAALPAPEWLAALGRATQGAR